MSYDKIVEKFASEQIRMSLERSHLIDLMTYSNEMKQQYQERILELDMKIEANRQKMKELYKGGNQK